MTFDEFIDKAIAYSDRHPEQRFGQACMNTLRWVKPNLFRDIDLDIWEVSDAQDPAVFAWFYEVEQMW